MASDFGSLLLGLLSGFSCLLASFIIWYFSRFRSFTETLRKKEEQGFFSCQRESSISTVRNTLEERSRMPVSTVEHGFPQQSHSSYVLPQLSSRTRKASVENSSSIEGITNGRTLAGPHTHAPPPLQGERKISEGLYFPQIEGGENSLCPSSEAEDKQFTSLMNEPPIEVPTATYDQREWGVTSYDEESPGGRYSFLQSLSLIRKVFSMQERFIVGEEAKLYVWSMKLYYRFFSALCVPALLVLLPLYASSNSSDESRPFSAFDAATAQNIAAEDAGMWVIFLVAWLYSLFGYFFAHAFWKRYGAFSHIRRKEFISPGSVTLMLSGLKASHTTSSTIFNHFNGLYPDKVLAVHVIYAKKTQYFYFLRNAPCLRLLYEHTQPPPDELLETESSFGADKKILGCFVSFSGSKYVEECLADPLQTIGCHYDWLISRACSPYDIIWGSFSVSPTHRALRIILFSTGLALLSYFVVSPVALLYFKSSVHGGDGADSGNSGSSASGFFAVLLTGWLPTLMLFLINSIILPFLIDAISLFSGYWKRSSRVNYTLHANNFFLVWSILVIPILSINPATSFFELETLIDFSNFPVAFYDFLQTVSSKFTILYIINTACFTAAGQLLHFPQLFVKVLAWIRGQSVVDAKYSFSFGYWHAFNISVLTVTLTYGIEVPLVIPCGILFFLFRYYVDKFNFTSGILNDDLRSDGKVAKSALKYLFVAIIFLQLRTAGFFIVKQTPALTLAGCSFFIVAVVSFLLLILKGQFLQRRKFRLAEQTRRGLHHSVSPQVADLIKTAYIPPSSVVGLYVSSMFNE